jgi:hypothetical protein
MRRSTPPLAQAAKPAICLQFCAAEIILILGHGSF